MREEKAKLECQQRLVQLELLLRKDLDAAGLSDLYRKLSVASQVPLQNPYWRCSLIKPHAVYASELMIMIVKVHVVNAGLVTASWVSVTMQECGKSVDAAHADAMNMRNRQYQKLHRDYQNLSADCAAKRQLASRQASQISQLQVCTS